MEPPVPPTQHLQSEGASAREVITQQAVAADYAVLRYVVVGLIVAIISTIAGVVWLISAGHEVPDGLIAIGSGGIGALATMAVRNSTGGA